MTDEQNAMMDGTKRLRACEVLLRDSIYQAPTFRRAYQSVKSELERLETEVALFLPADYESDI